MLYKKGWTMDPTSDSYCLYHTEGHDKADRHTHELRLEEEVPELCMYDSDDKHANVIFSGRSLSMYFKDWTKPTESEKVLFEVEVGIPYIHKKLIKQIIKLSSI